MTGVSPLSEGERLFLPVPVSAPSGAQRLVRFSPFLPGGFLCIEFGEFHFLAVASSERILFIWTRPDDEFSFHGRPIQELDLTRGQDTFFFCFLPREIEFYG